MTLFEVKYLNVNVSSEQIEANSLEECQDKFKSIHKVDDDSIYHILNVQSIDNPGCTYLPKSYSSTCIVGNTVLNKNYQTLSTGSLSVNLSKNEFTVMNVLMNHLDSPLTVNQLMISVYGEADVKFRNPKIISTMFTRIRNKLYEIKSNLQIVCIRGAGYIIEVDKSISS